MKVIHKSCYVLLKYFKRVHFLMETILIPSSISGLVLEYVKGCCFMKFECHLASSFCLKLKIVYAIVKFFINSIVCTLYSVFSEFGIKIVI